MLLFVAVWPQLKGTFFAIIDSSVVDALSALLFLYLPSCFDRLKAKLAYLAFISRRARFESPILLASSVQGDQLIDVTISRVLLRSPRCQVPPHVEILN
jgi:hypothetical protein